MVGPIDNEEHAVTGWIQVGSGAYPIGEVFSEVEGMDLGAIVLASLTLSGGGLLALELQQAFIGMFLLTAAGALLVILVDGRLIKDRLYTLTDGLIALIAILGMFLPSLPIADYLLIWTPYAWLFLGGMVLLAILVILEGWRSF